MFAFTTAAFSQYTCTMKCWWYVPFVSICNHRHNLDDNVNTTIASLSNCVNLLALYIVHFIIKLVCNCVAFNWLTINHLHVQSRITRFVNCDFSLASALLKRDHLEKIYLDIHFCKFLHNAIFKTTAAIFIHLRQSCSSKIYFVDDWNQQHRLKWHIARVFHGTVKNDK